MFKNPFKKQDPPSPSPALAMRDLLFGDVPIDQWPPRDTDEGVLGEFTEARRMLASGDEAGAIDRWLGITLQEGLESRHYLQAWTFLRGHHQQPPAEVAKHVQGVVVEVGMAGGLDVLAAYQDHSARYINYSGAGVVWDRPSDSLDAVIDRVLARGSAIAAKIGPWDKPRPGPPPADRVRLSMLTPSGIHFGDGPMSVMSRDPFSAPLFSAATELMQALISIQRGLQS